MYKIYTAFCIYLYIANILEKMIGNEASATFGYMFNSFNKYNWGPCAHYSLPSVRLSTKLEKKLPKWI